MAHDKGKWNWTNWEWEGVALIGLVGTVFTVVFSFYMLVRDWLRGQPHPFSVWLGFAGIFGGAFLISYLAAMFVSGVARGRRQRIQNPERNEHHGPPVPE